MSYGKSAAASGTLWASLLAFFPLIVNELPGIVEQVAPILSPNIAAIASSVGGVIVILKRLFAENKPITSVLPK